MLAPVIFQIAKTAGLSRLVKVIVPRKAVFVLSSHDRTNASILAPAESASSTYAAVAELSVLLLNLITPDPGSESVVVVL